MSNDLVLTEQHGHVRLLTFNRVDKRNAFDNRDVPRHGGGAVGAAQADPPVRVIVITGAGDAFCAGQDFSEMSAAEGTEHALPGVPPGADRLRQADRHGGQRRRHRLGPHHAAAHRHQLSSPRARGCGRLSSPSASCPRPRRAFCCPSWSAISARRSCSSRRAGSTPQEMRRDGPRLRASCRARDLLDVGAGQGGRDRRPAAGRRPPHQAAAAACGAGRRSRDARQREDEAFQERLGTPENMEAISAFFERRAPKFD